MPAPVGPSNNREAVGTPIARGWQRGRARSARRTRASPVGPPSGREASRIHEARLRPGRYELLARDDVWAELERRGATIATVPFSGRAGRGGSVDRIALSRVQGNELVDLEGWSGRDELCYALEAPIWDRFGSFAGQPLIVGTVLWTAADRLVVIEGRRGEKRFEELV